jgi:hypothetical protein
MRSATMPKFGECCSYRWGKSKLNNASPEFRNSMEVGFVAWRKYEMRFQNCGFLRRESAYSDEGCVESSFASDGGAEIF